MVVVSELGRMSGVIGLYLTAHTDVEAVFVHNFYVQLKLWNIIPVLLHTPCQTSVQTFDRGGLGINFIRDGCTTVWFIHAPIRRTMVSCLGRVHQRACWNNADDGQ
jgi:hypothetical protein